MGWITPKTDWQVKIVDGKYVGDYFNAEDFNRIKNNLIYLHALAIKLYKKFSIAYTGTDKTAGDYFYADEINKLEQNLHLINTRSINQNYGNNRWYYQNQPTMNAAELNKIESATLDLYEQLTNEYNGRRKLTFNFGIKEVF